MPCAVSPASASEKASGTEPPGIGRISSATPAAGAAAAALLVAVVLWHHQPAGEVPGLDAHASPVEDMDLLADGEALDLMEGWDGSFYEWAAAQTDGNGESEG